MSAHTLSIAIIAASAANASHTLCERKRILSLDETECCYPSISKNITSLTTTSFFSERVVVRFNIFMWCFIIFMRFNLSLSGMYNTFIGSVFNTIVSAKMFMHLYWNISLNSKETNTRSFCPCLLKIRSPCCVFAVYDVVVAKGEQRIYIKPTKYYYFEQEREREEILKKHAK